MLKFIITCFSFFVAGWLGVELLGLDANSVGYGMLIGTLVTAARLTWDMLTDENDHRGF